jgi:hypothetical protein
MSSGLWIHPLTLTLPWKKEEEIPDQPELVRRIVKKYHIESSSGNFLLRLLMVRAEFLSQRRGLASRSERTSFQAHNTDFFGRAHLRLPQVRNAWLKRISQSYASAYITSTPKPLEIVQNSLGRFRCTSSDLGSDGLTVGFHDLGLKSTPESSGARCVLYPNCCPSCTAECPFFCLLRGI